MKRKYYKIQSLIIITSFVYFYNLSKIIQFWHLTKKFKSNQFFIDYSFNPFFYEKSNETSNLYPQNHFSTFYVKIYRFMKKSHQFVFQAADFSKESDSIQEKWCSHLSFWIISYGHTSILHHIKKFCEQGNKK